MNKFIEWWKTPITQTENLYYLVWFVSTFFIFNVPGFPVSIMLLALVIDLVILSKMFITGYEI